MLEPRGEFDLSKEPIRPEDVGQLGVEHFQGNEAVMLEVAGQVDRRHAPASELPLDQVAVTQRVGQGRGSGHGELRKGVLPNVSWERMNRYYFAALSTR